MRLTIEITTADPDDTAEEWEAMKDDLGRDPKHRLTLETRYFVADATVIREETGK